MGMEEHDIPLTVREEGGDVNSRDMMESAIGIDNTNKGYKDKQKLLYNVDDVPPFHITVLYALQQVIANIGGVISQVYLTMLFICGNDVLHTELLGASLVVCGICTYLQVTLGIRVPAVQMSAKSFIGPLVALVNSGIWQCQTKLETGSLTNSTEEYNTTNVAGEEDAWREKLLAISGSLAAASTVQVILGASGAIGFLLRFIGPITIVPTVSLIGLSMFPLINKVAGTHWGIAALTIFFILLFALILEKIKLPFPTWNRDRGLHFEKYPFFKLFPHMLALIICWILCYILTNTDVLNTESKARTDLKLHVLTDAPWIQIGYPGRYGFPTFSVAIFIGMLAATFSSIIESVGDYYTTCRAAGLPPPPMHAVNRGIVMEGMGSVLSGLMGICHGTTTYSGTVGFIGLTGMASRRVWQVMALILIIGGTFGKLGAALTIIPDPIIGGMLTVSLGYVVAVAQSNLQYVDLGSSRNLAILGLSQLLGLALPFWIVEHQESIKTGSESLDIALKVLLSTSMLVGGLIAFTLDNLCPGTQEERGLIGFHPEPGRAADKHNMTYDLPYITPWLSQHCIFSYLPFMPTYRPCRPCSRTKHEVDTTDISSREKMDLPIQTENH